MAAGATEFTLELEVATTGSALFDAAMLIDFDEARGFIPHAADEQIAAAARVPTGVPLPFAGIAIPSGFLECNGQAVSRTTFSILFGVISDIWGSGDGSTTFNLPDLRGTFPRGHVGLTDKTFAPADANLTSDEITITGHGFNRSGIPVRFTTTGGLPAPLTSGTDFFVIFVDVDTIQVATTRANAIAGTFIDLTTQGTGTHTIIQRLDPDASTRTAMSTGGATGDNVGARQDDDFKSHAHPNVLVDVGQAAAGISNRQGDPTVDSSIGGSETRPRNPLVKYIIKT
jgi:microcystin-dependent protein